MPTPLRVLVLEDRPADAELMIYELRQAGFVPYWQRVETDTDFVDSLDPELDIILADYCLPQFDALRALHRLQERGLDIPFIVVTASVSEDAAVECMRQGAVDYLLKDRLSRLGPAVRRALLAQETREEKRRAEEDLRRAKVELEQRVAERTAELRDLNERLTLELFERRRAENNLRFLAEASRLLARSLDYEATVTSLAQLVVPTLADWCTIDVATDDGSIRQIAVAHTDPSKVEAIRETRRLCPLHNDSPYGVPNVLRTGQPEIYHDITESQLSELSETPDYFRMCLDLGMRSAMIVPMAAHKRTLGVMSFILAQSGRNYGPSDLGMAVELAHRAALAVDNARLYQQAQEAIRTRDKFLSTISHDLKNPLTSIKATAQLLMRQVDRLQMDSLEGLKQSLVRIDANASKMNAQISELLDVARLQMGQTLEIRRSRTDLVALARQIAYDYQQTTDRHQIVVNADRAELVGEWDTVRLERAIGNLVANAIKYSPDGGAVTITASLEREGDSAKAVLSVADEGIGIPADDLRCIFEQFRRASNATERISGIGIGLASARQIVEQHSGTITVTSELGKGSVFVISLPLTAAMPVV